MHGEFLNNSFLSGLDNRDLFDTNAPEIEYHERNDNISSDHPPGEKPVAFDVDGKRTLLIADSTIGTDGFHMEDISAAGEVFEGNTMRQGVTIAPVFVLTFHPVHKLEALALVVVTCCELNGESGLIMSQFQFVGFIECLWQNHTVIVHMTRQNLFFTEKQLCEHHAG